MTYLQAAALARAIPRTGSWTVSLAGYWAGLVRIKVSVPARALARTSLRMRLGICEAVVSEESQRERSTSGHNKSPVYCLLLIIWLYMLAMPSTDAEGAARESGPESSPKFRNALLPVGSHSLSDRIV